MGRTRRLRCVAVSWLAAGLVFSEVGRAQGSSTVVGVVVETTTARSIPDATIEIAELSRSVRSNARGAFVFEHVPPGDYTITARAIGFARFRTTVRISEQPRVEVPIALPRVTSLDTVVVSSMAPEPLVFLEARSLGLGSFVSHDLLSRSGDRRLGDILTTVRSVGVVHGRGGKSFVYSKRNAPTLRQPPSHAKTQIGRSRPGEDIYYPDKAEEAMGIVTACYARVYLDRQLLNPGSPAEPVNINDYAARDLVGIEFYAGPSSVPPRLANLNSTCGIVVLHTRRYSPP